ncbi:IPTL-CTERM sorting domain-containing protein [Comamonas piscis]|uniref:IPTL-CTERM sorting domain-containing protein n=1 Tax=Comamonas piscis TaxID=1562974 RepID=A0A7G5EM19_9BURK|nr:IPTL-CTERM sorting domain-containing protein [Comamonas piscis]QMV75044.1 IPTL-CTERM sorting domain-containing protein [Comamonas piscis]WSO33525.1 IPTL-CTERM sorting domain-containing protein [Comamonas piscis]
MNGFRISMAHYLGLGCAVAALLQPLAVQAQTAPVISCSTDPAIFNTGIDGSNGYSINSPKLALGSKDAHWSIASALGDITTPAAAAALTYAQGPVDRPGAGNGAWVQSPFGNAQWIGVQYGRDYYVYQYHFTLDPAVDPDSFNLSLNLYVDNQVRRILVNDAVFDYTNNGASLGVGGFGSGGNVPVVLNNGFRTGTNTIYVVVGNQGDPSGLLVQSSGTASCSPPLSVAKQAVNNDGSAYTGLASANAAVLYDITVTNASTRDASGARLRDTLPDGLQTAVSSWSCSRPAGSAAVCPVPATGSFPLDTVLPTLPAGSALVFRVNSRFSSPLPAGATVITNIATIEPPATSTLSCDARDGFPTPCSASASVATSPLLSVTKTVDATGPLYAGQNATYTVTVKNEGAAELTGVALSDTLPAGFASATWSCQSPVGSLAVCPQASGSLSAGGTLSQTIASMRAKASLVYTVVATVDNITTRMDQVSNTASVTASNAEWLCYNPASAQVQDKPCSAAAAVDLWPNPLLQLSKTAQTTSAVYAGQAMNYSITALNAGQVPVTHAHISDPLPAGLENASWSCSNSGAAPCVPASGTGAVDVTVASLAAGDSVTIQLATTISAQPPASLVNTASLVVSESNAQCTGSTAHPCIATATVVTTTPPVPSKATAVPSLQQWSLALLTILTAGIGAWRMRKRVQRIR